MPPDEKHNIVLVYSMLIYKNPRLYLAHALHL